MKFLPAAMDAPHHLAMVKKIWALEIRDMPLNPQHIIFKVSSISEVEEHHLGQVVKYADFYSVNVFWWSFKR